jgi:hypothetical protein
MGKSAIFHGIYSKKPSWFPRKPQGWLACGSGSLGVSAKKVEPWQGDTMGSEWNPTKTVMNYFSVLFMYIQCIYIYICILFNKYIYIYIIIYTYTALHYITTLYCHLPIGCSMGVTRLEINRWKRTYTTVVIIPLLCVLSMSTSTFIYMYMHRYVYVYVY